MAAVYPDEGDVRAGVEFGPNGDDYTGTLVLPDESVVITGTGFGAGGTECTGIYYPLEESHVRSGVPFGANGAATGLLVLPEDNSVTQGVGYGANGGEFYGRVSLPGYTDVRWQVRYGPQDGQAMEGLLSVPAPGDVRQGTAFGGMTWNGDHFDYESTGSLDLPAEADVRGGTEFDGETKSGTLVVEGTRLSKIGA